MLEIQLVNIEFTQLVFKILNNNCSLKKLQAFIFILYRMKIPSGRFLKKYNFKFLYIFRMYLQQ